MFSSIALGATVVAGCDDPPPPVAIIASVSDALSGSGEDGTCVGAESIDAQVGTAPSISGGCSYDPEGELLEYTWDLVDAPTGAMVEIFDPTLVTPTFVPDVDGKYVLSLVVSADGRDSEPVFVDVITSGVCGVSNPIAEAAVTEPAQGGLPADCGAGTISVTANNGEILLDASASVDPDNNEICGMSQRLDYRWEIMSTPVDAGNSDFDNPEARVAVFDARENGLYEVRLVVVDETGLESEPITCTLDVTIP